MKKILLSCLFTLIAVVTFAQSATMMSMARAELDKRGLTEAEVRTRLLENGIDVDNIPPTEYASYQNRVIEILDQLYQYGEAANIKITKLGEESYEEDETPDLGEMADLKADTGDASELISGEEMKNRLGITQEELNRISDVDFA